MMMAAPMAPLYSIGQDDWSEVQHDMGGPVKPMVPLSVSRDHDGIINDTISFFISRRLK